LSLSWLVFVLFHFDFASRAHVRTVGDGKKDATKTATLTNDILSIIGGSSSVTSTIRPSEDFQEYVRQRFGDEGCNRVFDAVFMLHKAANDF